MKVEASDKEAESDVVSPLEGLIRSPADSAKREEHHEVETKVGDPRVDLS